MAFIGPSAAAIRAMGLKDAAKALMEQSGVPVVPGYHGENQDGDFLAGEAGIIGFPVLIKARAGGGGKGMRRVDRAEDFSASLDAARREAQAGVRRRCGANRKIPDEAAPYRNPGVWRPAWQCRAPVRAGLLAATAPSKSDRGGAGAGHDGGNAPGDGRGGGAGGPRHRLLRRRHGWNSSPMFPTGSGPTGSSSWK